MLLLGDGKREMTGWFSQQDIGSLRCTLTDSHALKFFFSFKLTHPNILITLDAFSKKSIYAKKGGEIVEVVYFTKKLINFFAASPQLMVYQN